MPKINVLPPGPPMLVVPSGEVVANLFMKFSIFDSIPNL